MDFVDFVENILDVKLFPYQKKFLHIIEKTPYEPQMLFARGQSTSRWFYGWIYKKLWEEYCETGDINILKHFDTDSFQGEYECIWGENDEQI